MNYLGKDRKKNLVAKSTLSNVNPPQQFCDSRLAKPASYLPLGFTHLNKPVGPGQTKKSVDKLKCVNAVGLGSVNSLSRADQPKRYTGRLCGTQPRSRTKTITKRSLLSRSIPNLSILPRNWKIPVIKGLQEKSQTKAHAIADVSDAVTSLSLPILNLLLVTVGITCTKAR